MEAKPELAATGPTSKIVLKVVAAEIEWDKHFQNLLDFKKKHGHCLVPKIYPDNRRLSYWVFRQRHQYTEREKGNKSPLSDENEKKLRDIGFVFKVKGNKDYQKLLQSKGNERFESTWEKYFKELKEYKKKNGNCLVPKVYPKHPAFQGWVYRLRSLHKKRSRGVATNLSDEQIEKLNSLGFVWDAKNNVEWRKRERERKNDRTKDGWEECYRELVAFRKKKGHTRVPKIYMPNQKLSSWVFRMRSNYKKRQNGDILSMPDDRLKKLNDINFIWQVRTSKSPSPVKSNAARQKTTTSSSSSKKPSKMLQHDNMINMDTTGEAHVTAAPSGNEHFADGNSGDDNLDSFLKCHTKDETEHDDDETEDADDETEKEDDDETEDAGDETEDEDDDEGSIKDLNMEDVSDGNEGKESIQCCDTEDLTCAVASATAKHASRRRLSIQSPVSK